MAPPVDAVLAFASGVPLLVLGALLVGPRARWGGQVFFGVFAMLWGAQVLLANLGRVLDNPAVHASAFPFSFALAPPAFLFLAHAAARDLAPRRARWVTGAASGLAVLAVGVLVLAPSLVLTIARDGTFRSALGPAAVPLFIAPFFGAFYLAIAASHAAHRAAPDAPARYRARGLLQALALFITYATVQQLYLTLQPPALAPAVDPLPRAFLALFFGGGAALLLGVALAEARSGRRDPFLLAAFLLPAGWGALEVSLAGTGLLPDSSGLWRLAAVATLAFHQQNAGLLDAFGSLEAKERQLSQRVREIEALNQELRAREERHRAILDSIEDGYLETDLAGKVTQANGFVGRILEREPAQLEGQPVVAWLDRAGAERLAAALAAVRRDGRPSKGIDVLTELPRGGTRDIELSLSLIRDLRGQPAGFRCFVRDVSERRRADEARRREAEQERELQRLREEDRFKSQFINTAAHELNTPLTPIKLQLELLQRGAGGGDGLGVLHRNVLRLEGLVRDMLEVARLQAGRLRLEREPTDLAALAREAGATFAAQAAKAGIALEVRAGEPVQLAADPRRLGQVLDNLLDNALKFTPPGGRVEIEAGIAGSQAVVRVRDTGRGLTAEERARLFRPFVQVHDTTRENKSGTGLGLFISRGLAELHGGALTCESAGLGKGSTFTLQVPLFQVLEPVARAHPTGMPRA